MQKTKIPWADYSWNPVSGCTPVSPACQNCYARATSERFPEVFRDFSEVKLHEDRLNQPMKLKKPSKIFLCSMGDLFHEKVPDWFLFAVFKTMSVCKEHVFQVLTKRPERIKDVPGIKEFPCNVWLGVTVENQYYLKRVEEILRIGVPVRFISFEPLLGLVMPIESLKVVDWIIVGGETGPQARKMNPDWVKTLFDFSRSNQIPFFFKQWGSRKGDGGRLFQGKLIEEFPEVWHEKILL